MSVTQVSFKAKEILDKHPTETLIRSVEFAEALQVGESLSGTPTVTPESGSGLTISSVSRSGTKVSFLVSAGNARPQPWTLLVSCTVTGGAVSQTKVGSVLLRVAE